MQDALSAGGISEGHTRPVLMLADRPEEQKVLFQEIMQKKLTVREAESIARRIAYDRVRKHEYMFDPEMIEIEQALTEKLGTRVQIERREVGGKLVIDFFSNDDLRGILAMLKEKREALAQQPAAPSEGAVDDSSKEEKEKPMPTTEEDLYSVKNFSV